MTLCLEVLQHLETGSGSLPAHLAEHAATCSSCLTLLASWPQVEAAGQAVRRAVAPHSLVQKLVTIPRLPLACEQVVASFGEVLDGEASPANRKRVAEHVQSCDTCRASWEALATLKQVGQQTRASGPLLPKLAAVALPRLAPAARRTRLAAAALYIVAGTLVLFSGNREWLGRELNQKLETTFFYGRAVVENRLRWVEKQAQAALHRTQHLARQSLSQAFEFWRQTLGGSENRKEQKPVPSNEEEGRS